MGVGSQVGSQNLNPQLTSSDSSGRPWHKRACPDHCFEAIAATPETNKLNTRQRKIAQNSPWQAHHPLQRLVLHLLPPKIKD